MPQETEKEPTMSVEQNSSSSTPRPEQEDVPTSDEATFTSLDALIARIQEVVDNLVAERYPQSNAVPTNVANNVSNRQPENGPVARRPNGNKDALQNQHNVNSTSARNSLPFPTSDDIAAIWLKRFLTFLNIHNTRYTAVQHELLDDERTVSMIKQRMTNRKADGQKQYQFNICNETWETNSPLQVMKSILNGISPMTRSNTSQSNQEELLRLYKETATSKESLLTLIEDIKTNISFERQLLSSDLSANELHIALNMTSALVTRSLNIWAVQNGSEIGSLNLALPTPLQNATNYGAFNTFCEYISAAFKSVQFDLHKLQQEAITELFAHLNLQASCSKYNNQDHHEFNSTSCACDTTIPFSPRKSKPTLHHILGVADLARIVESYFSGSHNGTPRWWSVCRQLSKEMCTIMDPYLQDLALRFSFGRKTKKAEEALCRLLNKTTNANRVQISCYIGQLKKGSFTVTCQRPIILDRNNSKELLFRDSRIDLQGTQMAILSQLLLSKSTTSYSIKITRSSFMELNMNELRNSESLISLDLFGYENFTDVNALRSCTSLHTLLLFDCINLSDVSVLGNCASLHTLTLHGCENLSDVSGLVNCASLHTLLLSACESLSNVSVLGNCASLHTLKIFRCKNLSDVNGLGNRAPLHTLKISSCTNLSDVSVLGNCAPLHTLGLSGCKNLSDVNVLRSCTSLHTLDLSDSNNLIDVSVIENCASLHTLKLSGCYSVRDVSVIENCASLHTLKLSGCYSVRDVSKLGNCASLHTLNLSRCEYLSDVSGLGNCASLHTLDLSRCEYLSDVSGLGNCASLHTLKISSCTNLSDVSGLGNCASLHTLDLSCCTHLSDVSGLGNCASLHTLDLSRCTHLTDVRGLGKCASLHTLNLSRCYYLLDVSVQGNCALLYTLDLSDCTHLSDVSGLGKCASLHTLNLSRCYMVRDLSELRNCASLHNLDLSSCKNLSDLSVLRNCASLQTLKISSCKNLSDLNVLRNCASLHTLKISSCRNLSDVSVLGNCASLHTLTLHGCENLSDVSVLGNCASLHTLTLHGCENLTDVRGLGNCASLHTLDLSLCGNFNNVRRVRKCASLRTFNTRRYGVNGIRTLANIKSLKRITLPDCVTIKSSGIYHYF